MHHLKENYEAFVGKGVNTEPRVTLRNIKDFFTLDQISKGTASMDVCELPSTVFGKKAKLKSRQTARKSTNSKLKFLFNGTEQSKYTHDQELIQSNSLNQDQKSSEKSTESFLDKHCSSSTNDIIPDDSKVNKSYLNGCSEESKSKVTGLMDDLKVDPIKLKFKNILSKNSTEIVQSNTNSEPKVESIKLKLKSTVSSDEVQVSKPPIKIFLSNVSSCPTIQKSVNCEKSNNTTSSEKKLHVDVENSTSDLEAATTTSSKSSQVEELFRASSISDFSPNKSTENGKGNLKRSVESDTTIELDCKKSKVEKIDQHLDEFVNPLHGTEIKTDDKANEQSKDDKENKNYIRKESFEIKWIEYMPDIKKFVLESCQKEIELQLKLEENNVKYIKLKEKYDSLEETFRSWIKFADDLQARVRKMVMHFQKQAESVKVLKAKNAVHKVSVAVQTEMVFEEKLMSISKSLLNECQLNKHSSPKIPLGRDNPLKLSANTTSSPVAKRSSDVIDLTGETESQNSCSSSNINCEVRHILQLANAKNGAASKIFPPNKTVSRNSQEKSPLIAGMSMFRDNLQLPTRNMAHAANVAPHSRPLLHQQIIRPVSSTYRGNASCPSPSKRTRFPSQSNIVKNKQLSVRPILPYPPLPSASFTNTRIPRNAPGPPPELQLAIKKEGRNGGIVLSWTTRFSNVFSAKVVGYELYAFHQSNDKREWRKIGDDTIKAMDLPMACTLSQFSSNCSYYFAVRGKDIFGRFGPFSIPCSSKDVT